MLAFLDFEASSLAKHGYPIEVAWVFEDGNCESHLIRPAPDWADWDARSEAIHGLSRDTLVREGEPHDAVASRMIAVLAGHDLLASAPSWDGKWLSVLLRAAGQPRHALRLRKTRVAQIETAAAVLGGGDPRIATIIAAETQRHRAATPAHRALPDAQAELRLWQAIGAAAREQARQPGFTLGNCPPATKDQP